MFLSDSAYASVLSLGEIHCPLFTDVSPYEDENQDNDDKFDPEKEVSLMCEKTVGVAKELSMELSEQCFENKIPYYEWPHMALISEFTYGCSKEDRNQIVESFSPKNPKNKIKKNEMIQQIKSFSGIPFATTNLRKTLDSAMDRRFTSKVEFFAMKKEGVEKLCNTYFGRFNLDADGVQQIYNAGEVCPGDFHVVQSRIKVMDPDKVSKDIIRDSLIQVVREKNAEEGAKIGFGR